MRIQPTGRDFRKFDKNPTIINIIVADRNCSFPVILLVPILERQYNVPVNNYKILDNHSRSLLENWLPSIKKLSYLKMRYPIYLPINHKNTLHTVHVQ